MTAYNKFMYIKYTHKVTDIKLGYENVRQGGYILHIPTGKHSYSILEGSQIKNKEKALRDLEIQMMEIS